MLPLAPLLFTHSWKAPQMCTRWKRDRRPSVWLPRGGLPLRTQRDALGPSSSVAGQEWCLGPHFKTPSLIVECLQGILGQSHFT